MAADQGRKVEDMAVYTLPITAIPPTVNEPFGDVLHEVMPHEHTRARLMRRIDRERFNPILENQLKNLLVSIFPERFDTTPRQVVVFEKEGGLYNFEGPEPRKVIGKDDTGADVLEPFHLVAWFKTANDAALALDRFLREPRPTNPDPELGRFGSVAEKEAADAIVRLAKDGATRLPLILKEFERMLDRSIQLLPLCRIGVAAEPSIPAVPGYLAYPCAFIGPLAEYRG